MFIAHLSDGTHFREVEDIKTWDDVPDIGISSLQLTLPFSVQRKLPDGEIESLPPSTVTLSGFDQYYFSNEAVAVVIVDQPGRMELNQQAKVAGQSRGTKVAQIIGGIDRKHGIVAEIRVDNRGNVKHTIIDLSEFEARFVDPETRQGSFDPGSLRRGK